MYYTNLIAKQDFLIPYAKSTLALVFTELHSDLYEHTLLHTFLLLFFVVCCWNSGFSGNLINSSTAMRARTRTSNNRTRNASMWKIVCRQTGYGFHLYFYLELSTYLYLYNVLTHFVVSMWLAAKTYRKRNLILFSSWQYLPIHILGVANNYVEKYNTVSLITGLSWTKYYTEAYSNNNDL